MRFRRPWQVLTAAMMVALSLVAAGCADPVEDDPRKAFVDAVRAIGDQPGTTVTARLVADAGNIASVAESGGEAIDVEDVEKVLDSSVAVSWHEGADADDPDDDQGQVVVTIDGNDDVETRHDGEDTYLRVDVRRLLGLSDDAPSSEEVEVLLTDLEAGGFDFARPAYEGRWLRLVGAGQAQSFFEGLVEGGGQGSADTAEQAERFAAAAQSALRDLLRDEVEVVHVGADSVGDKVVVSLTVGALADALVEVLETADLGKGLWTPDPDLLREELAASGYADEEISVEAWIAGGSLRQVRLDLVALARQFDEHGEVPAELDAVHLELEFAEFRDGVAAPDDAVDVDLFKVMGQALGGVGSGLGGLYEEDWEDPEWEDGGSELLEEDAGWSEPGTADPGTADPGTAEPGTGDPGAGEPAQEGANTAPPEFDEPDWEQMTDEEFDEWMREFERQLEEGSVPN